MREICTLRATWRGLETWHGRNASASTGAPVLDPTRESAELQCPAPLTYLKGYAEGREAKAGIADWIAFYNHLRPHQALANRTPMAVWRDGITGGLGEKAVDMTLRLDNARALPTYPQPPRQQQAA